MNILFMTAYFRALWFCFTKRHIHFLGYFLGWEGGAKMTLSIHPAIEKGRDMGEAERKQRVNPTFPPVHQQ